MADLPPVLLTFAASVARAAQAQTLRLSAGDSPPAPRFDGHGCGPYRIARSSLDACNLAAAGNVMRFAARSVLVSFNIQLRHDAAG